MTHHIVDTHALVPFFEKKSDSEDVVVITKDREIIESGLVKTVW
jgi:hypothetical protein